MSGLAGNIFKIALDLGEFQVGLTRKTFGYKFIWHFKTQTKVNKQGFFQSENLKVLSEF